MELGLRAGRSLAKSTFLVCLSLATAVGRADVTEIGLLNPSNPGGVSIGFEGIAFDGQPGALVLDRWSWGASRVSLADASVISTQISNPVPHDTYNDQLVLDAATGGFYTLAENETLRYIAPGTLNNSVVGPFGVFPNFLGMAEDPAGNLWAAMDHNSAAELWSVNKQSGAATLTTTIPLPVNRQLSTMTIGPQGQFIISVLNNNSNDSLEFYQLNPLTGGKAFLSQEPWAEKLAKAYDPVTAGYYGIENGNVLVKITGVPEPGTWLLSIIAAGGFMAVCRRSRRRARVESRPTVTYSAYRGRDHAFIARGRKPLVTARQAEIVASPVPAG